MHVDWLHIGDTFFSFAEKRDLNHQFPAMLKASAILASVLEFNSDLSRTQKECLTMIAPFLGIGIVQLVVINTLESQAVYRASRR